MKVLVTGGAGFIGSHLTRQLLKNHHEVVVLDNLTTGNPNNLPSGVRIKEMDIRDENLSDFIIREQFDRIVHLAGQTMVNESIQNPRLDASINVMGTLNLLESARIGKVERIVFASTAAVYGDVEDKFLPVKETQPLNPLSFYALTKMTAENYLRIYSEIFGVDYVTLRFSNVYGEYQSARGEGGVISIFAKRATQRNDVTVYGDGLQTRDFIHAEDIAAGIGAALITANKNLTYNLSTQTEVNLNSLIKIFSEISDHEIRTNYQPHRQGDIRRSILSNEKAKLNLHWQPKIDLASGLRRTYQYFESTPT